MELNYDVPTAIAFLSYQESTSLWHRRLGHLNLQYMKILKEQAIGVHFKKQLHACETCTLGKHTELLYKRSSSRASKSGELINTDLCEVKEESMGNADIF